MTRFCACTDLLFCLFFAFQRNKRVERSEWLRNCYYEQIEGENQLSPGMNISMDRICYQDLLLYYNAIKLISYCYALHKVNVVIISFINFCKLRPLLIVFSRLPRLHKKEKYSILGLAEIFQLM